MEDPGRQRLRTLAALAVPLLLLGWRLAVCPPALLWRDGAAILSAFAAFVILVPRGRSRQPVTMAVMLLMLAAYGWVQIPLALDFMRQAW